MIDTVFAIIGLGGALVQIVMYFCLQTGKVDDSSRVFYAANGLGSAMVAGSLIIGYKPTSLGAIVMEAAWLLISAAGVFGNRKHKELPA